MSGHDDDRVPSISGRLPSSSSSRSFGRKGEDVPAQQGGISPLHEEDHLQLDLNLEDMEGIVDPTLVNAPPDAYRFPTPQRGSEAPESGSMLLQDALHQTSSFVTSLSTSSGSASSKLAPDGRAVVAETDRLPGIAFQRSNPFRAASSGSSFEDKPFGPPSPHTMSPKHTVNTTNQPRRPSQLRNVKMGSLTSTSSSTDSDTKSLQPIAPAWAAGDPQGQTVFQDPFGAPGTTAYNVPVASGTVSPDRPDARTRVSSSAVSSDPSTSGPSEVNATQRPSTVPSNTGPSAAWAAPESWGVEGDAPPDDEASSDEWSGAAESLNMLDSPSPPSIESAVLLPSPSAEKKPPPFGHNSTGKFGQRPGSSRPGTSRPRTKDGRRPGTARPGTARPGTSGSVHASNLPHWIRMYRADGSHSVMSFPLMTTTAEIINVLSGANDASAGKKVSTSMRLYVRERGQGGS